MSTTPEQPTPETDAELTRLEEFDFAGVKMEGNFVSSLFSRRLERERDEAKQLAASEFQRASYYEKEALKSGSQLEAMRSAIEDAHGALDALATFHRHSLTWKTLNINDALAKLQPFLKQ